MIVTSITYATTSTRPPDVPIPGEDAHFPDEWSAVLATVFSQLGERIEGFWSEYRIRAETHP